MRRRTSQSRPHEQEWHRHCCEGVTNNQSDPCKGRSTRDGVIPQTGTSDQKQNIDQVDGWRDNKHKEKNQSPTTNNARDPDGRKTWAGDRQKGRDNKKTIGIKKTKITHTARQGPTRNQLLQNRKRVQQKTTKYTGQKWRNQRSQSKPKTSASFQSNAEEWPFQSSYEKCWNHESEPQPVKGRSTADETRSRYSPKQEQEILFRNYKKAH